MFEAFADKRKFRLVGKNFVATLLAALLLVSTFLGPVNPPAQAASCSKINAIKVVSGNKFVCKKVNGKLAWVKQGAGAVASPNPSVKPANKPSPKPKLAAEWSSCKTAGHTVLGQGGMLACVKLNYKMVWVSYATLDSKEIGAPCKRAGEQSAKGSELVKCEQFASGKLWSYTGLINPAHPTSVIGSGNVPGGCSFAAELPRSVTVKVVYSAVTQTNWCVAEIRETMDIQLPANHGLNESRFSLVLVGGGGGGGPDGGAGGSGGEVRYASGLVANPGQKINVKIGQGGAGGTWISTVTTPGAGGQPTSISGLGSAIMAAGGSGGGGWGSRAPNVQRVWGMGLSRISGSYGGYDLLSATHGCQGFVWKDPIAGQDGPLISIAPGITTQLAAGGGGGWAFSSTMPLNYQGSLAGKGGGGGGAALTPKSSNVYVASSGAPGLPNTGSGGGGGAACDIPGANNGVTQRTWGGAGGSGVAIIAFELQKTTLSTSGPLSANFGLTKLPLIEIKAPVYSDYALANIRAINGFLEGNLQVRSRLGRLYFDNVYLSSAASGGTALVIEIPGYETFVLTVGVR
jgi:hypothetical protein